MKIQINTGDVQKSDAMVEHINGRLEAGLKRFADRITRVEVHLHDETHATKAKGTSDKRCTLEIRLAGHQPLAVEAEAANIYDAVTDAVRKAERAIEHRLERENERRSS